MFLVGLAPELDEDRPGPGERTGATSGPSRHNRSGQVGQRVEEGPPRKFLDRRALPKMQVLSEGKQLFHLKF